MRSGKIAAVCAAVVMLSTGISAEVSAQAVFDKTALTAPQTVSFYPEYDHIEVSWDKVSGAESYNLYMYDEAKHKFKKIAKLRDKNDGKYRVRYDVMDLEPNTEYRFKVEAVKGKTKKRTTEIRQKTAKKFDRMAFEYKMIVEKTAKVNVSPMYSLYDITGDGIPELFVSPGDAHASGVEIYSSDSRTKTVKFVSVTNESGKKYYEFGSFGVVSYIPENNVLVSTHTGQGVTNGRLYSFRDGSINTILEFEVNSTDFGGGPYYKVNGKKISEKQFDAAYEKYVNTDQTEVLGRDYCYYDDGVNKNIMDILDEMAEQ